jgi:geranylgeranyl diphosphate synthase type I
MPDSKAPYKEAMSALESHIQEYFQRNKTAYSYGDWFEPLYFDLCEYVGRKGKRIRPLLLMACYQAFGGRKSLTDPSVLTAAMSVELLHSFILMHDDIIDRSEIRRGLPTFHKLAQRRLEPLESSARQGESLSIVIGDMVFAMSLEALMDADFDPELKVQAQKKFLRYATDTGAGEILDILLGVRDISRVNEEEIEEMYYLKTTRYTFEAPCVLGATLAGASKEQLQALTDFVRPIGLAFQIDNDLKEFRYLDGDLSGLPTDLLEGKKTLLIHEAYDALSEVDRNFLQMCLGSERKTESTLIKIYDLVRKSGAMELLSRRTSELFEEAESTLTNGVLNDDQTEALRKVVGGIRSQIQVTG